MNSFLLKILTTDKKVFHILSLIKFLKIGGEFDDDNADVIKLVDNAFAHAFREEYMHTSGSTEIDGSKCVGQVSTFMRVLTLKDGDLLSYFDKTNKIKLTKHHWKN